MKNTDANNNGKVKMEFIARITDSDGQVIEKVVTAADGIPSSDDFDLSTKEGFLSDFDSLEKATLEARNKIAEDIMDGYMEVISQKKNKKKPTAEK